MLFISLFISFTIFALTICDVSAYAINQLKSRRVIRKLSVPEWTQNGANYVEGNDGSIEMLKVRFINTPTGKDVVIEAEVGSNLLNVADKCGINLPRECSTGLCGSCTCEVQDPEAIKTNTNPRDGFATIRACSSKCSVPAGMNEMVVDVGRMRKSVKRIGSNNDSKDVIVEDNDNDPMARFSGNWEKEFRPQWETAALNAKLGKGQVGGAFNPKANICGKCSGVGRLSCYLCKGSGQIRMGDNNQTIQCSICVGMTTVGCGFCRGTGMLSLKKTFQ